MVKILTSIAALFFSAICHSQDVTVPGWYHIHSGALTYVVSYSMEDLAFDDFDATENMIAYSPNEVVLVFYSQQDMYLCMDAIGRIILVKGNGSISKVSQQGRPVLIHEDVQVSMEFTLGPGNTVWLVDVNPVDKTGKILLANGQTVSIPQSSYSDMWPDLMREAKQPSLNWNEVH